MPTAEEFSIRKHEAVTSATCQLENTSPEKEPTSLSRGRRVPVSQHGSGSRSKLSSPFTESKEITSTSTVMLEDSIYSLTQAHKHSEKQRLPSTAPLVVYMTHILLKGPTPAVCSRGSASCFISGVPWKFGHKSSL